MSVFWGCLGAIFVWRLLSDLKSPNYDKIRGIVRQTVREELVAHDLAKKGRKRSQEWRDKQ